MTVRCGRFGAALAAGIALLAAPAAAAGAPATTGGPVVAPPPVDGYVLADQPSTVHYQVINGFTRNSTNGAVEIDRPRRGVYLVRFVGMGVVGGIAHARPYGPGSTKACSVAGWWASGGKQGGGDQIVEVRCFHDNGDAKDTRFVASFTNRTGAPGTFAYLLANVASSPHGVPYTPSLAYDSSGGPVTVQRNWAVGHYAVQFGTLSAHWPVDHDDGVYQVTAVGTRPVRCEVSGENEESAYLFVNCVDHDGNPVDSRFTLTYAHSVGALGVDTSPAANAVYRHDPANPVGSWWLAGSFSTAAVPVFIRLDIGRYQVDVPGLGLAGGHANAGARDRGGYPFLSDDPYCHVASWTSDQVVVECFDSVTDLPADSNFTVLLAE
jgi:hypothetical protein